MDSSFTPRALVDGDDANSVASARAACRRRRLIRFALFGGTILATLSVAAPAMAWPTMGC